MLKTRVVHRDCGGFIGWYLGERKKGDTFESKTFQRADGSTPTFGSKIREKCPKCGDEHVEEVMTDATVYSEVLDIEDDDAEYGDPRASQGIVAHFQCIKNGHVLTDKSGDTTSSLYDWLEENDQL